MSVMPSTSHKSHTCHTDDVHTGDVRYWLHVILFEPEIPPNTGNIIRLCANAGAQLHLIYPLGFEFKDRALRRAGLDYHQWADVQHYADWDDFMARQPTRRLYACTTKGTTSYHTVSYQAGDGFIFGPESRGLPASILSTFPSEQRLRIPMLDVSRSINLANAVSIMVYEAWRQLDFVGSALLTC